MTRHQRRDLFRLLGTLAIVVGVLGSLSAWETGQIGLGQAVVQAVFAAQLAYLSFTAAVNTRRRSHKALHRPAAPQARPHPAGRAA